MESQGFVAEGLISQEARNFLEDYMQKVQRIETSVKQMSGNRINERELSKLFQVVFKKVRKMPAVQVLKASDRDNRYNVWVSTNGVGLRSSWSQKSQPVTELREFSAMKADEKKLCEGLRAVGLYDAAKDMEDFLGFIPKFDGRKFVVVLANQHRFITKNRHGVEAMVDSIEISSSHWGGVTLTLSGVTPNPVPEYLAVLKGEDLAKNTSDDFAKTANEMVKLMDSVGVPKRELDMEGWEESIRVREFSKTDGVWNIKFIRQARSSFTLENIGNPRDIRAMMDLYPALKSIADEVDAQASEYVGKSRSLIDNLRERFKKQVIAEAL